MFYYPLSAKDFVFENIFASESISPYSFYKKRGFGIDYFYKIPRFHHEDAIILFDRPPKFEIENAVNTTKFILAIDRIEIDRNVATELEGGIIAYPKTIYLTKRNFKLFFFSEKEKRIACLKSETSLPTKGLKKFINNFFIISESDCSDYDVTCIKHFSVDKRIEEKELVFDRRFNYFKGVLYGVGAGLISSSSSEEIQIKRSFQEITNAFAELKNRSEIISGDSSSFYRKVVNKKASLTYTNTASKFNLYDYEVKLRTALNDSEKLFTKMFPQYKFSEARLVSFLFDRFKSRFESQEKVQEFVNHRIIDDEIDGTEKFGNLKRFYLKNSREISPDFYFEILHTQVQKYLDSVKSYSQSGSWQKDNSNDLFKEAIFKIQKLVEHEVIKNTSDKEINLEPIRYSIHKNKLDINEFAQLEEHELKEYSLIVNSILSSPKFGRGDAKKDDVLTIVEIVGNALTKNNSGRGTSLYQYLNNQREDYSLETPQSIVMKNFVAFVFNPNSIEKLQSYLELKAIDKKWIAFSFWCGFNGFANVSKNFLQSIFDTDNDTLQTYLDNYLSELRRHNNVEYTPIDEAQESMVEEPATVYEHEVNNVKVEEFFNRFIRDKYPITFEQFSTIIHLEIKEAANQLKLQGKIPKKDGKKIIESYNKFKVSTNLFP